MNNDIVSVSLFSGAGGLDVASVLAGIPVSVSTDIDSDVFPLPAEVVSHADL